MFIPLFTAIATHDYIVKIVPSVYEDKSGNVRYPYQYTYSYRVCILYCLCMSGLGCYIKADWPHWFLRHVVIYSCWDIVYAAIAWLYAAKFFICLKKMKRLLFCMMKW